MNTAMHAMAGTAGMAVTVFSSAARDAGVLSDKATCASSH